MIWLEIIGYLGSVLIILSLLMADIRRLRWFNLSGCIAFVIYGVIIEAYPVILLNATAALANIYHLWKLWRAPKKKMPKKSPE